MRFFLLTLLQLDGLFSVPISWSRQQRAAQFGVSAVHDGLAECQHAACFQAAGRGPAAVQAFGAVLWQPVFALGLVSYDAMGCVWPGEPAFPVSLR